MPSILQSNIAAELTVDVVAMADLDDRQDHPLIVDGVNDAMSALPDPVLFQGRQLFASSRPRVARKALNAVYDSAPVASVRKSVELFGCRPLDP